MDRLERFFRRAPHLRKRAERTLEAIIRGNIENLDIKPLKGRSNEFRCRIGNIRILFLRQDGRNIPFDIGFRGDIYKS